MRLKDRCPEWKAFIGLTAVLIILYALFSPPCSYSAVHDTEIEQEIIMAVEYEGLTRIEEEELTDIMSIRTGDLLDSDLLGEAVKRAFKKGVFRDVLVVKEPYAGGVKLKFILKEIPLIKKIILKGNDHFSKGSIKKIISFNEEEDFREEVLEQMEYALLQFYKRKGFRDAVVKIHAGESKAPPAVNLYVDINEGEPVIVKNIEIPEDAKEQMKLSEGDILNIDLLDKDMVRLTEYYKSQNYLNPVVGPYEIIDDRLIIPLEKGPLLELSFDGNTVYDDDELADEVPFIDDEMVSEETIRGTVERIRKLYLGKGYLYAQIVSAIEEEGDVIRVSFVIFEGRKVILRKVEFEGVSVSEKAVAEIVSLEVDKPYDENSAERSFETLTGFYHALGYLEMNVKDVKKEFDNEGVALSIKFIIDEGPQTTIKDIAVSGNMNIDKEVIIEALAIEDGAAYNMIDINDARYRALSLYRRHGYLDARVDIESEVHDDKASLHFRIIENELYIVGKIIVRGNYKTKPKIIKREFSIEEGTPCNDEEFLKIKQRLYKLGIFNEVSIDLQDTNTKINGISVKDVVVTLREGNPGAVELGIGYGEYEHLRGLIDIRYNNIGGYNREVGLRTEMSSVEERYVLNFREPWLFNRSDLSFNLFLLNEETRNVNIDTDEVLYKIDRFSLLGNIEKEITSRLKLNLSYEYSFVDTKDVDPDVILTKEDTGTLGIGSVSTSLFYDTRDNPFNPESGSINGIILKVSSKPFLSETEFFKGTFQSSWFFKLRKKVVLACSLKGGAAYAFEGAKELPLIERFFLGGRTTVRGYSHDTLGPKGDNNNPTGGNAFALFNGELRFDVGRGFGLVTFVDAGNVWRLVDDIGTELKYTAGAGLRYNTPVGPLRLDYGHKLRREVDLSSGEVHFSFGHAF
jgi:outer membrane protein insertion porin family